jgi:SET domain-containing protein
MTPSPPGSGGEGRGEEGPKLPLPFATRPSSLHGLGAFATEPIRGGARVAQYNGEKITKAESVRRCEANNNFIFHLDDDWDVDGAVPWNAARFLNHSCAPNCDAELIGDEIWIVARRDIAVGEELTFNYGYDLEDYRDYPCRCGAPECVGYIVDEEFFPLLRQRQQSATMT